MVPFLSGAIALSGFYEEYDAPILIKDINCTGKESSILDCAHNLLIEYSCNAGADAAIICQGKSVMQQPIKLAIEVAMVILLNKDNDAN